MAKRKNRKSTPNVPEASLERARQEASSSQPETTPPVETEAVDSDTKQLFVEISEPVEEFVAPERPILPERETEARRPRPPRSANAVRAAARNKRPDEKNDIAYIRNRLANPTRTVTTEDMHQQYGYVVKDLRRLALEAGALIVLLIIAARVIVQ